MFATSWTSVPQTNKLKMIRNDIKSWRSSYQQHRRNEVLLCRLRIGHTRLTHGYLMAGTHVRYCDDCLVPLTVLHVLAECPTWQDIRFRYFPQSRQLDSTHTLKEMLAEQTDVAFDIEPLIKYLRECTIIDKI